MALKDTALRATRWMTMAEKTAQNHPDFADVLGEWDDMVARQAKSSFGRVNASIFLRHLVVGKEPELFESRTVPLLLPRGESMLGRFSTKGGREGCARSC